MVDVGSKEATTRTAVAVGSVRMQRELLSTILKAPLAKGNVLEVARLAGIMAAKQTHLLIPLCHTLALDVVEIEFARRDDARLGIRATARVTAKTGVEMEALTAVSIAALTVYDMCKSIDRSMVVEEVRLEEKSGGRSGLFRHPRAARQPAAGERESSAADQRCGDLPRQLSQD